MNRRVSVGARGLEANRSRPEMAPQRFDKIESAPGNGRVSAASTHKIWYTGARLPRPTPADVSRAGGTPREEGAARGRLRLSARLAHRPGSLADSVMELRVTRPHVPFCAGISVRRTTRRGRLMNSVDFSTGKPKPMLACFHVAERSQPLRHARRALRAAGEAKKFGDGHFGFGTLVTP